jgi:hypothetical protein
MRRLCLPIVLLAALALAAAGVLGASPAGAAQTKVVADCNAHARLTQPYTVAELRNALSTMPADVKEYTNCYDVITRALLAQVGGSNHGGGGSGTSSGGSFLPVPLIIVLVVLILGAAAFSAVALRRRGAGDGEDAGDSEDRGDGEPPTEA